MKISFRNRGEIKIFPDIEKLKEFAIHRPVLKEMLKDILQEGRKCCQRKVWIYTKE